MAVPKFITNDMKGGYVGGPTTPVRRGYVGSGLVYQGFGPASEQEFIRQEATGGPAQLLKVYGKSIVNNQQIVDANRSGTASHTGSSTYMIKSLSTNQYDFYQHKVFIRGFFKLSATPTGAFVQVDNTTFVLPSFVVDTDTPFSFIGLINANAWHEFRFYFTGLTPSGGEVLTWHDVEVIDLTTRFGAGNEPTSVDAALRLLGGDAFNPAYDAGSLQSNKTTELRAERIPVINVWDEEWEVGAIDTSTGQDYSSSTMVRCQGYIPVTGGATYYFKIGSKTMQMMQFDANHTFLTGWNGSYSHKGFTTSGEWTLLANCAYIRFQLLSATTYDNDVCINLSDPTINGTYYPHWRGKLTLNLSTITSGGVVVFPYGMCRVGDIRDEASGSVAIKRIARVDLGSLNWRYIANSGHQYFEATSMPSAMPKIIDQADFIYNLICPIYTSRSWRNIYNNVTDKIIGIYHNDRSFVIYDTAYTDATTFKAAMSGVYLDYELATPLTYTLDTPLPTDLTCVQGDILQRVSDNNCPFVGEMRFGL